MQFRFGGRALPTTLKAARYLAIAQGVLFLYGALLIGVVTFLFNGTVPLRSGSDSAPSSSATALLVVFLALLGIVVIMLAVRIASLSDNARIGIVSIEVIWVAFSIYTFSSIASFIWALVLAGAILALLYVPTSSAAFNEAAAPATAAVTATTTAEPAAVTSPAPAAESMVRGSETSTAPETADPAAEPLPATTTPAPTRPAAKPRTRRKRPAASTETSTPAEELDATAD